MLIFVRNERELRLLLHALSLCAGGRMLNWAARYYPILRILKQHELLAEGTLLEIGCGPFGIGTFRKVPFVGCDLSFAGEPPRWPMTQVVASATNLPFEDRSFDAVVVSDVLEHIPPHQRETVVSEALRVAKILVVFGFPCGSEAHKADEELRKFYLRRKVDVPGWLEEHMLAEFPDETLFRDLPAWDVVSIGSENLAFHSWMMRWELHLLFIRASNAFRKFAPRLLEALLRHADSSPFYRRFFVLTRKAS